MSDLLSPPGKEVLCVGRLCADRSDLWAGGAVPAVSSAAGWSHCPAQRLAAQVNQVSCLLAS